VWAAVLCCFGGMGPGSVHILDERLTGCFLFEGHLVDMCVFGSWNALRGVFGCEAGDIA
jgi:hypothetical protein